MYYFPVMPQQYYFRRFDSENISESGIILIKRF